MRGNKRSSHLVILTDQAQKEMTSREDQDWVEARVLSEIRNREIGSLGLHT